MSPARWGTVVLAFVALTIAPLRAEDVQIAIQCSPAVVNLSTTPNGNWFTVHADIAYSAVDTATVKLNGISVNWTKVDNQGYLVAKFLLGDVRSILVVGDNELTLSGSTTGGGTFSGSTSVRVVKK
ncbi:MAG: hypothetical protein AB9869_35000 [Verrucomicrobiia bacterium]